MEAAQKQFVQIVNIQFYQDKIRKSTLFILREIIVQQLENKEERVQICTNKHNIRVTAALIQLNPYLNISGLLDRFLTM